MLIQTKKMIRTALIKRNRGQRTKSFTKIPVSKTRKLITIIIIINNKTIKRACKDNPNTMI